MLVRSGRRRHIRRTGRDRTARRRSPPLPACLEVDGNNVLSSSCLNPRQGINLAQSARFAFLGHRRGAGRVRGICSAVSSTAWVEPIDGGARHSLPRSSLDINGLPMNPAARAYPSEFIQTGVSTIDGLNTLVRGQKLPIFSGSGLPHANACRADRASGEGSAATDETFAVVFAAIGITFEEVRVLH